MTKPGVCLLLLLWPALSGAAIVKASDRPAAAQTAGDPKPQMHPRKHKPLPAPPPSNHYAATSGEPGQP